MIGVLRPCVKPGPMPCMDNDLAKYKARPCGHGGIVAIVIKFTCSDVGKKKKTK